MAERANTCKPREQLLVFAQLEGLLCGWGVEKRQKGVQETRDLEATESVKESGFIPYTVKSLCGVCVFLENVLRLW